MPAVIVHRLFGEQVLQNLPSGLVASDSELISFLIGCQGPDPLFFRWRTTPQAAKKSARLASAMHSSHMSAQLKALREGVEHIPADNSSDARAFALGWLCHYCLDRAAHPYIYSLQNAIIEVDPSLKPAASGVHAIIEGDLDSWLLWQLREMSPKDYGIHHAIEHTPEISQVAGALVSSMSGSVYHEPIPPLHYTQALADMYTFYRLIEPAGSTSVRNLAGLEHLVRPYSQISCMAHRDVSDSPSNWTNDQHLPWINPFTGASSTESFLDILDRAAREYSRAARAFVQGQPADTITCHIDYSGQPLDTDELPLKDLA